MEIKINKEIRGYRESIFFGLSLRQFVCSAFAVGVAAGIYFLLSGPLGKEIVSWLCIVGAAPVAAAGFFQYHGMTIEKFAIAVIKSALRSKRRVFRAENYYLIALNEVNRSKERNDKNLKEKFRARKRAV